MYNKGSVKMAIKAATIEKKAPVAKKKTQEIVKNKLVTRIQVKCDAGFGNFLTIRGQGANLSWSQGIPLQNIKNDEWLFETDLQFSDIEFKILINDLTYETGQNHHIKPGNYLQYHPKF